MIKLTRKAMIQEMKYEDQTYGLSLGAERTAEHEYGIRELKKSLGIDSEKKGIEKYQINNLDHNNMLIFNNTIDLIFMVSSNNIIENFDQDIIYSDNIATITAKKKSKFPKLFEILERRKYIFLNGEFKIPKTDAEKNIYENETNGLLAAWDSKSFAISARGKEAKKILNKVISNFLKGNLGLINGPIRNIIDYNGLNLIFPSLVPEKIKEDLINMEYTPNHRL